MIFDIEDNTWGFGNILYRRLAFSWLMDDPFFVECWPERNGRLFSYIDSTTAPGQTPPAYPPPLEQRFNCDYPWHINGRVTLENVVPAPGIRTYTFTRTIAPGITQVIHTVSPIFGISVRAYFIEAYTADASYIYPMASNKYAAIAHQVVIPGGSVFTRALPQSGDRIGFVVTLISGSAGIVSSTNSVDNTFGNTNGSSSGLFHMRDYGPIIQGEIFIAHAFGATFAITEFVKIPKA